MLQLRAGPAASRRMAPSKEHSARLAEERARAGADRDRRSAEERRLVNFTTGWPAPGAFCVDWEIPLPSSDGP